MMLSCAEGILLINIVHESKSVGRDFDLQGQQIKVRFGSSDDASH